MPAAVLIPLIAAGASAAGTVVAGKMASNAAKNSANAQTVAANHAGDLQAQAEADKLAYEREQAAQTEADFQQTQKANYGQARASAQSGYDQYAARERRLGGLGSLIGAPPREIPQFNYPDYAGPGTPQGGAPTGLGAAAGSGAGAGAVDGSPASISAFFKSNGVSDAETPYWVSKWPELVARGQEIGDPNYAMKRLAASDVFGKGGGGTTLAPQGLGTLAQQSRPMSSGMLSQRILSPRVMTPRLPMPGLGA